MEISFQSQYFLPGKHIHLSEQFTELAITFGSMSNNIEFVDQSGFNLQKRWNEK